MAPPLHHLPKHPDHHSAIRITGLAISDFSNHLLRELAAAARLPTVHITSVHRSVPDQARIFFSKHVVEGRAANYKNSEVARIVAHARVLHRQGQPQAAVQAYLIRAIEHVHGGPSSISNHLGTHAFTEVFDVGHYNGTASGPGRYNLMTDEQARAFLVACRSKMPSPISRLGHSSTLGFVLPTEFRDEKCFHFEVKQFLYDRLMLPSSTSFV